MKNRGTLVGFSQRLEDAIWASGLDIQEICKKADIGRTMLWNYRFNGVVPNCTTVVDLCKALNVSADYLLGVKVNGKD